MVSHYIINLYANRHSGYSVRHVSRTVWLCIGTEILICSPTLLACLLWDENHEDVFQTVLCSHTIQKKYLCKEGISQCPSWRTLQTLPALLFHTPVLWRTCVPTVSTCLLPHGNAYPIQGSVFHIFYTFSYLIHP